MATHETPPPHVPLAESAAQLGVSWGVAWRLLLTGALEGEKRQGRWYVSAASLAREKQRRATSVAA